MNAAVFILITAIYVLFVLLASWFFLRKGILGKEGARKLVHVLVSFSVFPVVYLIDDPFLRLCGPLAFIFINAVLGVKNKSRIMGLVCYPLSMLILIILMNHSLVSASSVVSGMLSMGLGDGAAALVGMKWGRTRLGRKSLEGSIAMFVVSSAVLVVFSGNIWYMSLLAAFAVTVIECITPHGLDNLTVPLAAAVLSEVL